MTVTDYWNHNVAHRARVLTAGLPGRRTALDIGSGGG